MSEEPYVANRLASGRTDSGRLWETDLSSRSIDAAPQMLQLATRLHASRADPQLWRETLQAFRECTRCDGLPDLAHDASPLSPDDLATLAGRLTHCATYGDDCDRGEEGKRGHCAAFAVHMHTAAFAAHKALQAGMFDHLPPTWIVDRSARICEANAAARAMAKSGERVNIVGARLALVGIGGARALSNALAKVIQPTRLAWKDGDGKAVSFLLRALRDTNHVAVTALLDPPGLLERAPLLAEQLDLTPRQGELAAHLLADYTLAGAARAMGISRHTANEHLTALIQRAGAADRKALLVMLRKIAEC